MRKVFKSNNCFECSPLLTDTLRIKTRPKSWGGPLLCVIERRLARSRCPFLMFGPVVSGKYCHRPVFFLLISSCDQRVLLSLTWCCCTVHAVSFWVFQWFQSTSIICSFARFNFRYFSAVFEAYFSIWRLCFYYLMAASCSLDSKTFFYSRASKFCGSSSESWISKSSSRSSSSVLCNSSKFSVSKVMFFWISMDSSNIVSLRSASLFWVHGLPWCLMLHRGHFLHLLLWRMRG